MRVGHNGADRQVKFARLCIFKPYRYLNSAEIRLDTDILEHFLTAGAQVLNDGHRGPGSRPLIPLG